MMQRLSRDPLASVNNLELSLLGVVASVFVIGLATTLRVWNLDGQSFTMDELTDLGVARADVSFAEIIKGARRFPPLYHLLLRGWLTVFKSDQSARWLSVVIGLIAIVVVWRLARHILGRVAGFWTAVVISVSPFHIWYSQETRVYGLFFLTGALTLLFFARALDSDSWLDWMCFAAAAACGMFTHYYFVLIVALTAAIVVVERRVSARLARPGCAYATLVAIGIPWLLLLLRDLEGGWGASKESGFGLAALGYTFVSLITGYTIGPSLRELHTMSSRHAILGLLPWMIPICLGVSILVAKGLKKLASSSWRWYLILLCVAPVLVVGIASELGPFGYNIRHVVWIFIPAALLLGGGLARWRNSALVVAAGIALLVISSVAIVNRNYVDRYRNEDAAAVADFIEASGIVAPVFVSAEYMAVPVDYYLRDTWDVYPVDDVGRDGSGLKQALEEITSRSTTDGGFWLAYSRPFHGDPGGRLLDALSQRALVSHVASFAGFELYRCQMLSRGGRSIPVTE